MVVTKYLFNLIRIVLLIISSCLPLFHSAVPCTSWFLPSCNRVLLAWHKKFQGRVIWNAGKHVASQVFKYCSILNIFLSALICRELKLHTVVSFLRFLWTHPYPWFEQHSVIYHSWWSSTKPFQYPRKMFQLMDMVGWVVDGNETTDPHLGPLHYPHYISGCFYCQVVGLWRCLCETEWPPVCARHRVWGSILLSHGCVGD